MTITTVETWAITYSVPNELGEFGIDIVTQDVEVDTDGRETGRSEGGWSWTAAPHGTTSWKLVDATAMLATLGYENIGVSRWSESIGGGLPCWEVPVRKLA